MLRPTGAFFTGLCHGHVLADGDVFHLGCNYALTGVVHLGHVAPRLGPARLASEVKTQVRPFGVVQTRVGARRAGATEDLRIAPALDPGRAQVPATAAQINTALRDTIRAQRVR